MTLVSQETVRDEHGTGHTVVTEQCDGPDCGKTIRSDDPDFGEWGSVVGFVNVNDKPTFDERPANANWCSIACLKAWVATLYVCDNCGHPVRIADGLHAGGYRHDDLLSNAAAEWCDTDTGRVRVTVDGFTGIRNLGEFRNEPRTKPTARRI